MVTLGVCFRPIRSRKYCINRLYPHLVFLHLYYRVDAEVDDHQMENDSALSGEVEDSDACHGTGLLILDYRMDSEQY